MKKLKETTIGDLMCEEFRRRGMLSSKSFIEIFPELIFKGLAGCAWYLGKGESDDTYLTVNTKFATKGQDNFIRVCFYYDKDGKRKIDFYNSEYFHKPSRNDYQTIHLDEYPVALAFMTKFAAAKGISFGNPESAEFSKNMVNSFACVIYAIESYMIATFDKYSKENSLEIPDLVKVFAVKGSDDIIHVKYQSLIELDENMINFFKHIIAKD